jgi:hypothetical protein
VAPALLLQPWLLPAALLEGLAGRLWALLLLQEEEEEEEEEEAALGAAQLWPSAEAMPVLLWTQTMGEL